jgi:hypothetical protein
MVEVLLVDRVHGTRQIAIQTDTALQPCIRWPPNRIPKSRMSWQDVRRLSLLIVVAYMLTRVLRARNAAQKRLRDLKGKISSQSKRNFVLERDVRYLDSRIALLIQNVSKHFKLRVFEPKLMWIHCSSCNGGKLLLENGTG